MQTKQNPSSNSNKFCTIYLIRHGQTEWNRDNRLQGQADSPLTERGIEQAKMRAKSLRDIDFSKVFSSDLLRAKRTAEIIASEHKLAVVTNKLLRERSYGKYEGMKIEKFLKQMKDLIEQRDKMSNLERFKSQWDTDVESDEQMVARFITLLREIALTYPEKKVAVIAHGAVLKALLIHLGWAQYQDFSPHPIENLAFYVLESDGIEFYVRQTEGVNVNKWTLCKSARAQIISSS